mgnify:CR=1 FL=1
MINFEPGTYPSRMFIRFTARNQLMADATGQPITAMVQRLGGGNSVQRAIPGGPSPIIAPNGQEQGGTWGAELSMAAGSDDESVLPGADSQYLPGDGSSADGASCEVPTLGIDEELFTEIVKTRFNAQCYPQLYRSCGTVEATRSLEYEVAAEIVETYRRIKQQQQSGIVQDLNRLL